MLQEGFPGFEVAPAIEDSVFFTLLPDRNLTARIAECGESLLARHGLHGTVRVHKLHMSLLALNPLAAARPSFIDAACRAAAKVEFAPFDVTLDRAASFKQGTALVLACNRPDTALINLQDALRQALLWERISSPRQSFTPHVTLHYENRAIEEHDVEPIHWSIDSFALVRGQDGKRYEVLASWSAR